LINTIAGLEKTVVARPGYAIEYDVSDPTFLSPSLESRLVTGLFLAGQINGTSGYEEAAAQGLWAGVGAALRADGQVPFRLGRDQALTGVMLDDLTVAGVSEPYRMFSSRAEYRLSLREDNADLRLSPMADELGLLDSERRQKLRAKMEGMDRFGKILASSRITPAQAREIKAHYNLSEQDANLAAPMMADEFLRRPSVSLKHLQKVVEGLSELPQDAALSLEIQIKYQGYLDRQESEMRRQRQRESLDLPIDLDYTSVKGLTTEAVEGLRAAKPSTLGQAGRIQGVTPASISALMIHLRKTAGRRASRI
jgi:tRNA uridine 5-carboxymethylaminomethyl modification enzyme